MENNLEFTDERDVNENKFVKIYSGFFSLYFSVYWIAFHLIMLIFENVLIKDREGLNGVMMGEFFWVPFFFCFFIVLKMIVFAVKKIKRNNYVYINRKIAKFFVFINILVFISLFLINSMGEIFIILRMIHLAVLFIIFLAILFIKTNKSNEQNVEILHNYKHPIFRKIFETISGAIELFVIIGGLFATFLYVRSEIMYRQSLKEDAEEELSSYLEENNEEIVNSFNVFTKKDYLVKIEINTDSIFYQSGSNFEKTKEEIVEYYEKGNLFRIDVGNKYNIIKQGELFLVDSENKTFEVHDMDSEVGREKIVELYDQSVLMNLMGYTEGIGGKWRKEKYSGPGQMFSYELFSGYNVKYSDGNTSAVTLHVGIDLSDDLVKRVHYVDRKNNISKLFNFQYEQVDNMESFKNFPLDYKKIN